MPHDTFTENLKAIEESFDRLIDSRRQLKATVADLVKALAGVLAHVGPLDPDPARQTPYEQALTAARAALKKAKQP